jgi:hypothetical protein
MARIVEVTHDEVDTDPDVVARYEGGGGGFSVEGDVTGQEACLRIPPHGDPVCTGVPEGDAVHTIQLVHLEPVLAGVAGDEVHRVTAERRDGSTSTVLPAAIGDTDVHGFSFTFGLDAVERLRTYDVEGDELETITPGR